MRGEHASDVRRTARRQFEAGNGCGRLHREVGLGQFRSARRGRRAVFRVRFRGFAIDCYALGRDRNIMVGAVDPHGPRRGRAQPLAELPVNATRAVGSAVAANAAIAASDWSKSGDVARRGILLDIPLR